MKTNQATVSVSFRCGHFESLTKREIAKQQVEHSGFFPINGKLRAVSGQYCLACSMRGQVHYS
jgi:hypothetical protein